MPHNAFPAVCLSGELLGTVWGHRSYWQGRLSSRKYYMTTNYFLLSTRIYYLSLMSCFCFEFLNIYEFNQVEKHRLHTVTFNFCSFSENINWLEQKNVAPVFLNFSALMCDNIRLKCSPDYVIVSKINVSCTWSLIITAEDLLNRECPLNLFMFHEENIRFCNTGIWEMFLWQLELCIITQSCDVWLNQSPAALYENLGCFSACQIELIQ